MARGAQAYLELAEGSLRGGAGLHGRGHEGGVLPNTGYYLPVIYAITGHKVENLDDMRWVLDKAEQLIPPAPAEKLWLPYLGETLDAGMAALWLAEIIEALKYVGVGRAGRAGHLARRGRRRHHARPRRGVRGRFGPRLRRGHRRGAGRGDRGGAGP